MKKSWMKNLITVLLIAAGNFLLALGIAGFIMPFDLVSGGCTGLALLFHRLLGIRVSTMVMLINIAMFGFGYVMLGRAFAMGTLLSSILYPLFLRILEDQPLLQNLTSDRMLATVCAGMLVGVGVGLVFKAGASTGGTDPIPLTLHKYLGVSMGAAMYLVDLVIILGQVMFSEPESLLYGIIFVVLNGLVIDRVAMFGEAKVQVLTISGKYAEIRDAILHNCDMGATLVNIETGFEHRKQNAVMTVTHRRGLNQLQQQILAIDPSAFIQITDIAAVHGRGFTIGR